MMGERAAALTAWAALDVLRKDEVLAAEGTRGNRIAGTEEGDRGDADMCGQVRDGAVVGDDQGTVRQSVKKSGEIELVAEILHAPLEAAV